MNFPLSTYSVFAEKNVSQKKENTFEGLKRLYIVRRAGQARRLLDSKSGFQGNLKLNRQIIAPDVGVWRASA